jgi:hypothetical protein
MIDVKELSDDELWLLTCGIEELHDSMRHSKEEYVESIVDHAAALRNLLETEVSERNLDHKRWQR